MDIYFAGMRTFHLLYQCRKKYDFFNNSPREIDSTQ